MPKRKPNEPDFPDRAEQYARQVVSGEIAACRWVKLACQRHLDDLERARKGWTFKFDRERASEICEFIELLPHIEGTWDSVTIKLQPWQIFILCVVFGWIGADGNRRFRTAYTEVPRKNAKSTISSGVGLYLLAADGEPGAQVYSLATNKDQARITFKVARAMTNRLPGLKAALGIETLAHALTVPGTESVFKALSSDADGMDGHNIHGAIIDEFHAHPTPAVWDVVNTATGARKQPLRWIITTAGFNRAGVCYQQRNYVTKVLEGTFEDDRYFGIIYGIDDGDDWTSEEIWRKANPNYAISVSPEDLQMKVHQAKLSASETNSVLTKHFNVWVSGRVAFFNMQAWDRCRRDVKLEDFEGQPCWIGLDLAAKHDLAAKMLLFERQENGQAHFYLFGRYYLPEAEVERGMNANAAHYAGWARAGRLILTQGNKIDYEYIERDILDDYARFDCRAIAFDPREMTYLHTRLNEQGIGNFPEGPMFEFPVNTPNYSEPMKEMEALILDNRLHHDGDPLLTWTVSNVVAKVDAKDMVFPRKELAQNSIDPVTAAIASIGSHMRLKDQFLTPSVRSVG